MMWRIIISILFILPAGCKSRQELVPGETIQIQSSATSDEYVIEIKKPENYKEDKPYHLVFIADGTIGLGDYILGRDSSWSAVQPENCIFITIGHKGDWEEKRRRDFIPSDAGGYQDKNFGHADHFYQFLKTELVPGITQKFPHYADKSFIGHSFSGLFCLYATLQNDKLFDRYFAISPSVWANDEELIKIEETFSASHTELEAEIHMFAGGLEVFNKVLASSRKFYNTVKARRYKHCVITFDVISNANHFSIRKPAIDRVLKSFQD